GLAATSDDVRVVDKSEAPPTFGEAASDLADGMYQLVQASFYQSTTAESAIRSLRATLSIRGRTLTLGAQDMTVAGHPAEALTFLFQNGSLTKTCDAVGGGVSSWFFPFPVGQGEPAKAEYDGDSGFVRLIIPRSDGSTELVFSK